MIGAAITWLVACGGPAPALLPVEYAGCVDTTEGCELAPGEPLRLWAPSPGATAWIDGRPLDTHAEATEGGTRLRWDAPTAGVLTVRDDARTFALRLREPRPRPWEEPLRALARDGETAACREAGLAHLAAATPADRGAVLWALAGCDLRGGDRAAAVARMTDAARAFDAAGRTFEAARARCALSSVLFGAEGALGDVRALLAEVPDESPNATLAGGAAWHRALLERRSGDYRAAIAFLDTAHAIAARVGLDRERILALEQRAVVDAELGHLDAAVRTQRALATATPFDPADCAQGARAAARSTTLAWFLLLQARDRGRAPDADVVPLLERSGEVHRACGHAAREIANVEVNLALAAWLAGDTPAMRAHLAAARVAQPEPDPLYAAWSAELEGRLALADGRLVDAEASFDRAVEVARLRGAPDALAQALAGRAEVRWSRGASDAALVDLAAAHEALWDGTEFIPLDAGAAAFLSTRRAMTEQYVAALLDLGRAAEAMDVVRAARSHLLRAGHVRARVETLEPGDRARWDAAVSRYRAVRAEREAAAADAWSLSAAELAARAATARARDVEADHALDAAMATLGRAVPPSARAATRLDDLVLTWFPLRGRWVAFAAMGDDVDVARVGALPTDAEGLGRALLSPFSDALARATRVVVLPWGDVRAVDLHALSFRGAPLLAHLPVVYSLDIGAPPDEAAGPPLVVADPTGDLPGARAEAELVRAARPDARVLLGGAAGRAGVLAALGEAGSLHYAGHATFREGDAWAAGLSLADGVLRVGDVLALPRVPSNVVLSACETGRTAAESVETWGLAQAFVAGGAAAVVATSRPVADRAGTRLAAVLYGGEASLPEATRAAQLALLAEGSPDWSAFRVWVP